MIKNKILLTYLSFIISSVMYTGTVSANNSTNNSALGTMSIITSPFLSIQGEPIAASTLAAVGTEFILSSVVEKSSDILEYTITSTVNSIKYTMQLSKSVAISASIAIGTLIKVVSESTGHVLIASGNIIAFIPNQVGKALIESTQINNSLNQ